jgi:hypothetical protein
VLADAYKDMIEAGHEFEIVFVSFDRSPVRESVSRESACVRVSVDLDVCVSVCVCLLIDH